MNRYGAQIQLAWREASPGQYARIVDPEGFFTRLGEHAEGWIADLQMQLAGPESTAETVLERAERLEAAKNRAAEILLQELLVPPHDTGR